MPKLTIIAKFEWDLGKKGAFLNKIRFFLIKLDIAYKQRFLPRHIKGIHYMIKQDLVLKGRSGQFGTEPKNGHFF